ncbi:MAG: GNAT family N-acetyltransferase [Gammaproteobacteria bacterium]
MGRDKDIADHDKKELSDPRESIGEVIVATLGERIVGTLICTPSWTNALGDYEALYRMHDLGACHPQSTGIITKLMVAPEYRNSRLSLRISRELYRHAVPLGVHHPIIDCNAHLVPFFQKIGFRKCGEPVVHPSYGRVHVLKLDCLDLEYIERIRSPLQQIARDIAPALLETDTTKLLAGANL